MKFLALAAAITISSSGLVLAQSPVPEPDTLKNQVRQTDPTPQAVPPGIDYTTNKKKITTKELPKEEKKTLEAGSMYQGGERGTAYKDKEGKLFIVQWSEGDTTRTFRFN